MDLVKRADLPIVKLPGRMIQTAVGKGAAITSEQMTVGFGRYSAESGPMEPHNHAEEVVYVVAASAAWVRFGPSSDQLGERIPLEPGMVLHNPALEWHVYEYDAEGYADLLFIYGQVDGIRPEDTAR